MITFATLLVGSGLVINVINVADTVPRYDLKPTCRAAVNLAAGPGARTIENCMAGENAAQVVHHAAFHPLEWIRIVQGAKRDGSVDGQLRHRQRDDGRPDDAKREGSRHACLRRMLDARECRR